MDRVKLAHEMLRLARELSGGSYEAASGLTNGIRGILNGVSDAHKYYRVVEGLLEHRLSRGNLTDEQKREVEYFLHELKTVGKELEGLDLDILLKRARDIDKFLQ